MKPKIGLVGTGQTVGIAHFHTLGLLADGRAEISGVYDLDQVGAARFVKEHGLENTRVCISYPQLLESSDAVLICTPNFTHIDYVLGAIQADRAVFVEKPLAISTNDSRRALRAIQGKPLFNMVGFVLRYAYVIQALRKLVQDDIGRVYTFQASYGGRRLANPLVPLEWRMIRKLSGTGALGDFGSHLVDLASYTSRLTLTTVTAMATTLIPHRPANQQGLTKVENDDQAAFIARTVDNALAAFTVSRIGMDDLRLLVIGEGGLARVDLAVPNKLQFLPALGGVYNQEFKEITVAYQKPFEGWFVSQAQAFVDGLTGKPIDVPDLHQGHYVESVLEAAAQACANDAVEVAI